MTWPVRDDSCAASSKATASRDSLGRNAIGPPAGADAIGEITELGTQGPDPLSAQAGPIDRVGHVIASAVLNFQARFAAVDVQAPLRCR